MEAIVYNFFLSLPAIVVQLGDPVPAPTDMTELKGWDRLLLLMKIQAVLAARSLGMMVIEARSSAYLVNHHITP